jgi:hypothetical protein
MECGRNERKATADLHAAFGGLYARELLFRSSRGIGGVSRMNG